MLAAASARPHAGLEVRRRRVNGDPSVLLLAEGSLFAVLVLDLTSDGDQVCGVYAVTNPDKLPTVESS